MKPVLLSVVAPLAVCLWASAAIASDLTLNGQTSVQLTPGASLQIELTGNPGLLAYLVLDVENGPVLFKGTSPLASHPSTRC
jgi:hypothetical protein